MKSLRVAVAVVLVAAFAVLVQAPAQAYPGLTCTITDVDGVSEGDEFQVTATVNPNVESDWLLTYDDQTHTDTDTASTSATFEATDETDVVAVVTQEGNTSTCVGSVDFGDDDDDDGNGGGDGDGGGILPNTGGERLAWLVIGAMLVLVGGGVVLASRRRDADA